MCCTHSSSYLDPTDINRDECAQCVTEKAEWAARCAASPANWEFKGFAQTPGILAAASIAREWGLKQKESLSSTNNLPMTERITHLVQYAAPCNSIYQTNGDAMLLLALLSYISEEHYIVSQWVNRYIYNKFDNEPDIGRIPLLAELVIGFRDINDNDLPLECKIGDNTYFGGKIINLFGENCMPHWGGLRVPVNVYKINIVYVDIKMRDLILSTLPIMW